MRWLMLLLLLVGMGSAETIYHSWGSEEIHADGSRTPVWGHPTYLSWDGSWHSKSDLNFQDGRWSYYVEDYTTSWKVTTRNGTFRLPQKSWIEYDFGLFEIKETLHIPALQALVDRSVVHNASVRYIPLPWSPSVVFSQVGNALSLGDWRTGDFWIRDNSSYTNENGTFANYSYYDVENHYQLKVVNGEIRLYFDDLTWFQNAVYPLVIDPTWITNSSSPWGDGVFDQTVEYGNGRIKLDHNQTGLVLWQDYSENTGTDAYDYTSYSNDGTLIGPEWTTGKYGTGIKGNASSQYVSVSDSDSLDITNNITINLWFNSSEYYAYHGLIDKEWQTTDAYTLELKNSNVLRWYKWDTTSPDHISTATISLEDTWYHITLIYNGTHSLLYLDGILDTIVATTGSMNTNAEILRIGASRLTGDNPYYFNGIIDEVYIYNRPLSAEEINSTKDGQTRHLTGNYTSPDYDCGSGNIAQNISIHYINSSGNTNMNIYVNMSADNTTWDSSYSLVQAGALNGTEYDITNGKRYIKYRTQHNTTTGAETDELYEVRVECISGAPDTTPPTWDELPTNQIAEYGTAFSIEFNATDADTPPVVYIVNDTDNFAFGSSTGILTNNTYLSIGVYYLQLNASDSVSPANINSTDITVTVSDNTNPTITWYNQTNSTGEEVDIDINTRRLLNLTWNLTDPSPINISSCSIQIRINDTTINSTEWLYENDTLSSNLDANGWWTHPCTLAYNNSDNTSISIYAELPNTLYYRATTMPIPIDNLANDTTDTIFGSNVVMLENSNATIEANYLYVTKHNINPKTNTKADSRQWYCNKTYRDEGWGDFRTSPYCGIGASISVGDTKVDGSDYFEKYGSSDENATFGGIGISDPSYFISEAIYANNENQGWAQKGTSGHSGHSYASDDYGVTWTLKPDTEFDMVIQWFNSMYFEARVNITDNEGNTIVDMQTDYFDTVNRAPEAAFKKDCAAGGLLTVYNECNISELGTLNISADFLDPDTNLVNCTFILLNNDSSYNQTLSEIETNTSYGICSFQYDTTAITNGDYYFKVNVTDGLLTGSDSTYDFVRIENPSPQPAPTLTNHTCTPGTFTLEITATYNASAHNASLNYGNTTALGTLLWNTTTGTSFTFNPTSLDQNTTYYFNFTSYNSTGDFLVNGTYNCTTNPYTPPTWTQDNAINIWLLILLLTLAMTLHILGILIESSTINFTAYSLFLLIGLAIMAAGIQIESGETATIAGDITTKIATFSIINTIFINSYGVTILLYGLYGMITAYTGRKLEDDDEDKEFNRQEEYFNERT